MNRDMGKEAYCTDSMHLLCPRLNEIPAGCLIFINNLHVHFSSVVHCKRIKLFLCANYPSRNRVLRNTMVHSHATE